MQVMVETAVPLLQCGGGALRAPLGSAGPVWAGLPCCCIRSATAFGRWRQVPPACRCAADPRRPPSTRFFRPRGMVHGETTVMAARSWWRALVGGKDRRCYSERLGCGFLEVGRNPCRLDTDAVTPVGVAILPEGRRVPLSLPSAYRGKP